MILDKKQIKVMKNKLLDYIKKEFPKNAKSWNQATDELPTIGYWIAEELQYNKYDKVLTEISKSPAMHNRKWYDFVSKNFDKLDEYALTRLAERFGHWFGVRDVKLFESQDNGNFPVKNLSFMVNRTKQFITETGVIFENLIDAKNGDMQISLLYHLNNSNSFEGFIDSINSFLNKQDIELTDNDKVKLESHVNKYA